MKDGTLHLIPRKEITTVEYHFGCYTFKGVKKQQHEQPKQNLAVNGFDIFLEQTIKTRLN